MNFLRPLIFLSLLTLSACIGTSGPVGNTNVPQPKKPVDLSRYLGKWYELARYENRFEKGCEAVSATYSLKDDGMIKVLNACRIDTPSGAEKSSEGKAKVVEGSQNAKLKVSFFGPFYGDYWVLDRADDYSWAIVGEPSGRYLWLLARDQKPSESQYAAYIKIIAALGYDLSLLKKVQH